MTTQTPTLLMAFRAATNADHQKLEDRLQLLSPTMNLNRYKEILSKFFQIYSSLEPIVEKFLDSPLDYARTRRKLKFLETDLRVLGIPAETISPNKTLDPANHETASLPYALGIAYVLEGATLGGQHIAKHLQKTLSIGPDNGGAFFLGNGEKSGALWSAFKIYVEGCVLTAAEREIAVTGAANTFKVFVNGFNS